MSPVYPLKARASVNSAGTAILHVSAEGQDFILTARQARDLAKVLLGEADLAELLARKATWPKWLTTQEPATGCVRPDNEGE